MRTVKINNSISCEPGFIRKKECWQGNGSFQHHWVKISGKKFTYYMMDRCTWYGYNSWIILQTRKALISASANILHIPVSELWFIRARISSSALGEITKLFFRINSIVYSIIMYNAIVDEFFQTYDVKEFGDLDKLYHKDDALRWQSGNVISTTIHEICVN